MSNEMRLTKRELEVGRLIVAGDSYQEIGKKLGIDSETVKTYVMRMRAKLRLDNKVQIAVWLVRHDLA